MPTLAYLMNARPCPFQGGFCMSQRGVDVTQARGGRPQCGKSEPWLPGQKVGVEFLNRQPIGFALVRSLHESKMLRPFALDYVDAPPLHLFAR